MPARVCRDRLEVRTGPVRTGGYERDYGCIGRLRLLVRDAAGEFAGIRAEHNGELGARRNSGQQVELRIGDVRRTPLNGLDIELLHAAQRYLVAPRQDARDRQLAFLGDGRPDFAMRAGKCAVQADADLADVEFRITFHRDPPGQIRRRLRTKFQTLDIGIGDLHRHHGIVPLATRDVVARDIDRTRRYAGQFEFSGFLIVDAA